MNEFELTSDPCQSFVRETPRQAQVWMRAAQDLGAASALDPKTAALGYIAAFAALRLVSGILFHVTHARSLGAGIELHTERETLETAEIFRDLSLPRSEVQTEPLTKGRWKQSVQVTRLSPAHAPMHAHARCTGVDSSCLSRRA